MGLFKKKRVIVGGYDSLWNDIRILQDSMELIENTINADTYFPRYKLAVEKARDSMEETDPVYAGMSPREIYTTLGNPNTRDRLHMEFIDRAFAAGREDRFEKEIEFTKPYMSAKAWAYYEEKMSQARGRILVTVTGIQFYEESEWVAEGDALYLIKDPANPYDSDAIRVESEGGEQVGSIANSENTLLQNTISATALGRMVENEAKVIVLKRFSSRMLCELVQKEGDD